MPNETKSKYIQQLRNLKMIIQSATDSGLIRHQVNYLKECVQEIMDSSTGDIQRTAQTTMEKIKKFELYDVTRFEVCRWVQTLISQLNLS